MNRFPILVALLFGLSVILRLILRLFIRSPKDKAKAIIGYAHKRGYALVNPSFAQAWEDSPTEMLKNPTLRNSIRASSDIADIEELADGTGDWLAFTCNLRSKDITIFNLSVPSPRADGRQQNIHYKVAKIRTVDLPRFSLGRNSVVHSVENVVARVLGAPKLTVDIDERQYPEFAAHYWIRGTDSDAVTAFLSSSKIKFLESAKLKGVLATNAHYLVYFEYGVLATDQDFDSFVAQTEILVANFF